MGAFEKMFDRVVEFDDESGSLAVGQFAMTKEEAREAFERYLGRPVRLDEIRDTTVRFFGRYVESEFVNAWWIGEDGPGSKKVWVYYQY